jgi:beta-lactam-binding protein with PASTA domain
MILVLTLAADGLLGFQYYKDAQKVKAIDFINHQASELYEWCSTLNPRYACKITYEPTKDVEKDKVFYQSVAAGEVLKSEIAFKVSSGLIESIDRPMIDQNTTRLEIEKWASKNGLTDVSYIEEESATVEKGIVIRIEPLDHIYADTPVKVYLSSGSKNEESKPEDSIIVEYGRYVGKSVSEFEKAAKELGLVPFHNTDRDSFSSNVKEGNIVWHGSGNYEKNEKISYGISKGVNENEIIVKSGDYIGKTEEEFIAKAKELKLKPNHKTERDEYSDDIAKGNIIWHGSGSYVVDEVFNYGLSLGKKNEDSIEIKPGSYFGKTVDEFEKATTDLKLKPYHDSDTDEYSDTIAKGLIVWHGSGTYEVDESIRYGLSLGKASPEDMVEVRNTYIGKTESDLIDYLTDLGMKYSRSGQEYSNDYPAGSVISYDTGRFVKGTTIKYKTSLGKDERINVTSYAGKTESEFLSFLQNNGLKAGSRTEASSSSIASGSIISNDTGYFNKGSSVDYKVSTGPAPEQTASILRPQYYMDYTGNDFDTTKTNLKNGPFSVFTSVEYVPVKSSLSKGQITKITVNGDESYASGKYPVSTPIKIYIVNEIDN